MYQFNGLSVWTTQALALDFTIIILLFVSLKLIKGWVSNLHANDEITQQDNFAFGISFAAGLTGLSIVISGVTSGSFADTLTQEALEMAGYGLIGIALIKMGHVFLDKVALPRVNLHGEIVSGNVTAALIDLGHVIAVAIVIRAALLWVLTEGWFGLPMVLCAYVLATLSLLLVSQYRVQLFRLTNKSGDCLQQAIKDGNIAVGVRYAGFMVGSGLAITASSGIATYDANNIYSSLFYWIITAVLCLVCFTLLHLITIKVILSGTDISEEVNRQQNIGVAAISAAISFAIGLTMATLLGS